MEIDVPEIGDFDLGFLDVLVHFFYLPELGVEVRQHIDEHVRVQLSPPGVRPLLGSIVTRSFSVVFFA